MRRLTDAACERLDVETPRIGLVDDPAYWGFCDPPGFIAYTWRMILCPKSACEYLAAHEACHLVHLNHTKSYWRLLERICPDTPRADRWLDANYNRVFGYGCSP